MLFTVFDTSTTVSPFSTPSLKSSKYRSFILPPPFCFVISRYSPRGTRRLELEDEVPQRHAADVRHCVDDRLAEVHHARRFLRCLLAVDDLPEQRSLVDADLHALAVAVALARVPRGEPLLVDEEALALVHDRIFRRRDDF